MLGVSVTINTAKCTLLVGVNLLDATAHTFAYSRQQTTLKEQNLNNKALQIAGPCFKYYHKRPACDSLVFLVIQLVYLLIDLKWFYRTCEPYGLRNGLIFIKHPYCRAANTGSLVVEIERDTIRFDQIISVFCL